jgi:hypothetical protein
VLGEKMIKQKAQEELITIAINQETLKTVLENYFCKNGEKITWLGMKRSCDDDFFAWDFKVQFNIEKGEENKFITAYDPKIKRRCAFVVIGNYAYSLITGFKFKLTDKELKRLLKKK